MTNTNKKKENLNKIFPGVKFQQISSIPGFTINEKDIKSIEIPLLAIN